MDSNGHAYSDRSEFERQFSRSYQRAYNLAFRYTGNESDAEDLTQDAFVRAWGSYHRYDKRRSFEIWLLRILSNLAIDRWRRQSAVRVYSLDQGYSSNGSDLKLGAIVPDHSAGPEQRCMDSAVGDQIHAALRLLPDAYRTAIILTDIEEWSYEEVARKMHCPVGTVRSRLHRGRQLLRQYLGKMQSEEPVFTGNLKLQAAAA